MQDFDRYDYEQETEASKPHNGWKVVVCLIAGICFVAAAFGGAIMSRDLIGVPEVTASSGEVTIHQAENSSQASDADQPSDQTESGDSSDSTGESTNAYTSIADIAADVSRSVVTISVETQTTTYFGTETTIDIGSGIIIAEDDTKIFIATNYRVISSANSISVTAYADELESVSETVQGYYQGSDTDTDLAVIYVNKSDFTNAVKSYIKLATFGDSDECKLGDLAIAIGAAYSLNFGNSVTVGSISGLERSVTFVDSSTNVGQTMVFMQTDAAINPGTSGGPLINGRGEIIGICNYKIEDTDVEGMGFATPSSVAIPVLEQLVNNGRVSRPYLGITGIAVVNYSNYATEYGLTEGVYVSSVVEGGAAAAAGVEAGDVIIGMNGQDIVTFDDLSSLIKSCNIGDEITITVLRGYQEGNTQTLELSVVIGEKDSTGK